MRLPNLLDAAVTQVNPRDADFVYNESAGHLKHLVGVYFFETSQHPSRRIHAGASRRLGHRQARTQSHVHPPNPAHATGTRPSVLGSRPQPGCGRPRAGQRDFRAGLGTISRNAQRPADLENGSQPPTLELHFFTGIEGLDALPGRLTAVVLKSHHSAADGIAIRMLGEAIFSDAQRPRKISTCNTVPTGTSLHAISAEFPRPTYPVRQEHSGQSGCCPCGSRGEECWRMGRVHLRKY